MGLSIWELLIILGIVLIIFGGKKLRSLGSDLGGAIKSFRQSVKEDEGKDAQTPEGAKNASGGGRIIDAEAAAKDKKKA